MSANNVDNRGTRLPTASGAADGADASPTAATATPQDLPSLRQQFSEALAGGQAAATNGRTATGNPAGGSLNNGAAAAGTTPPANAAGCSASATGRGGAFGNPAVGTMDTAGLTASAPPAASAGTTGLAEPLPFGGRNKTGAADPAESRPDAGGLSSLFGQALNSLARPADQTAPATPVNATAAPHAASPATEVCDKIVERILVSQPAADGSAEVRIKLDRQWVADTEVRIIRSPAGGLAVEFECDNLEAQRFLIPNLGALRDRLTAASGAEVAVRVMESAEHPGGGGSSGDGHSRNKRSVYEEMEDGNRT